MTTRALVLVEKGVLRYEHARAVPPAPSEGCALVRVAACGVCGSDLPRAFDGKAYHYPLVLGHEFAGVVEVPAHGGRLPRGARVAVFPLLPKPGQPAHETGDYAQTTNYDYFGSRRDGGMEELLPVPEANLFPVPAGVPLLHAACVEPAAVALHGVRKFRPLFGRTALVLGAGPVGLFAAQWLRRGGAARVLVADVDNRKLAVARTLDFEPLNSAATPLIEQVLRETGGEGAHAVVEAVGLPITFAQALATAATFGEVVLLGNLAGDLRLSENEVSSVLRRELTVHGAWNSKVVPRGTDDWSTVLAAFGDGFAVAPLLSDAPGLEDGAEIFASLRQRRKFHHKVVFRVTPELC